MSVESIPTEQAQRYLPFKLYNELTLNPGPEITKQCIEHLTALLQTVQTYCSAPILAEAQPYPHNVQGRWREATLLFADISGFTLMSERLNARGQAGAEEITRVVNAYFTTMVNLLHENGGDLLKFGGDAMLGMFSGPAQETARQAARAAQSMQEAMVQFAEVETLVGRFSLQMKVGLHTGRVFTAHVGTASQTAGTPLVGMEYWITGEDVNHTALAEEVAREGQIVVSQATRQYLDGWLEVEPLPDAPNFYRLPTTPTSSLKPQPVARDFVAPQNVSELTRRLDTLVPYLPAGLLPRLVYNPRRRRVEGEHRLVAMLFVNVIGFSELAILRPLRLRSGMLRKQAQDDSLSSDALTETMQDYFSSMQSIVQEHGGTINKTDLYTTGDKLLIIFGAPVAHEDDVDQAARAAVAMQEAMEGVNQRLSARCPDDVVRLHQRIGLSTGYVFSGNVGVENCQEYTIMGDQVNLAARLMSAAPWDETWVGSHVFYWLEPFGTFESVGTLSVKGKQVPVSAYRLDHMGETHRPRPPFVDRGQALTMLRDGLNELLQGQGQIVSLEGEPGIGKSRLLTELRAEAEAQDMLYLTGGCHGLGTTYHLLADLLRDYLKLDVGDDSGAQRRALIRGIEDLFGPEQVKEKGPFLSIVMDLPLADEWRERVEFLGERLSARLGQETAAFFERLTQDQPLVLVCDDLHWLDEGSADILLKVMELVEYAPIILGFTLRPGQYPAYGRVSGAATTQFFEWHRQIRLEPLGAEDSAQVVAAILGSKTTPEFQERVYQRSRGNPLFIGEIARTAITAPQVEIPGRVQKVIEGRVDALPEGPRRTIKAASVIGTRCTLPELVYALDERERDVRRNLATLRRMQLIDIKEKKYEFVTLLVREVTYNSQSDPDRKAFHHRLGDYWAGQEDSQKATHHYFAAEVWNKALEHGERAADQRREAYANKEAIRLYRQSCKAAEELGDLEAQSRLHNQLGQIYFRTGSYEQAVQAHQEELELVSSGPAAPLVQAKIHYALGRTYDHWGKYEQALNELENGLKLTEEEHNVTRAQLFLARCSVLMNTGQLTEAEQDGLTALRIARELGARPEQAHACNNLGAVYGTRGQYEAALEYHQLGLAIRRELDVAYDIGQSLVNVGTAFELLGKVEKARACYQEALEIQRRIGDRYGEGGVHHNLAWLHREQKQPQVAETEFLRALALWAGIDHRRGVAYVHNDLGTLYLGQGRLDKARDHLKKATQLYEKIGAHTYLPEAYEALTRIYLRLDRPQEALTAAQRALDWARQNRDRRQETLAYRMLGEVHLSGGDSSIELAEALTSAEGYAQKSLDLAQAEPVLPDQVQAAIELLARIRQAQESAGK